MPFFVAKQASYAIGITASLESANQGTTLGLKANSLIVGASLLAKNLRTPRGIRFPAFSMTTLASGPHLHAEKTKPLPAYADRGFGI